MFTELTQVCPFLSTADKRVYCFNECALYRETKIDEETYLKTCAIVKILDLLNERQA